ncbi:DNA mismatch repair endonuclease MutL [Clostridium sp. MCC353]|uniref:DNA mismatch repair endonuclease MutL n=1 Tax=Clostridium sp. MCC353 TaxID=2592646 RepID=UPI001C0213F7|nr:DNA mismatch repair endonuclease MutL [Clostridium sp. MCC353]MBT9776996.1 DNA mismatch repair endonuclease MutL [Clostridium sp. MCC353]
MPNITVLDQTTINKIAAGEVIERPASVVKELLENAIDAGATAVTVEIKDGGISFIRVTDNGCGIPREEIALAFLRHSTSKIRSIEDLFTISSLGFRGEALSSIAAVAQVELITKVSSSITGSRYQIEGGAEKGLEEIGAPEGTTFIVRNLFFNTPVRKKFLKTAQTEGAHVADLVEKIALSHPEVSIRFIQNNQNRLHTSGNHNVRDIIYTVFGREIAANLLEVKTGDAEAAVKGFIGKPVIARSNRNFENYYINGRYIKSSVIAKAIEDAYKPYMMQHKYPFTLLHFSIDPESLDVNVHPTKMELRFSQPERVYQMVFEALSAALEQKELIPEVSLKQEKREKEKPVPRREDVPEPFEKRRRELTQTFTREASPGWKSDREVMKEIMGEKGRVSESLPFKSPERIPVPVLKDIPKDFSKDIPIRDALIIPGRTPKQGGSLAGNGESTETRETFEGGRPGQAAEEQELSAQGQSEQTQPVQSGTSEKIPEKAEQLDLFEEKLLEPKARERHKLIGQLFDTYWLVEFNQQLYIIDQHAAHEKVLFEKTMASLKQREYTSQMVNPPIILTLSGNEEILLKEYLEYFNKMGFEIEHFGGKEYAVRAVPDNLFSIAKKELLMEMIDGLSGEIAGHNPDIIYEKAASMSCKAAVKGNHRMSALEADNLIDQLLELDNPYACPHGRPTIISMSKYELEKKFKRIV